MFKTLADFSFDRTKKQAVFFYLVYAVLSLLTVFMAGVSVAIVFPASITSAFVSPQGIGIVCVMILTTSLSFIIIKQKGLLKQFSSVVFLFLTLALAFVGGVFLGMLVPAFLTTRHSLIEREQEPAAPIRVKKSKAYTGLRKYVSIKGVLIGSFADIGLSMVYGFCISLVLGMLLGFGVGSSTTALEGIKTFAGVHPVLYVLLSLPGALLTVLGGYVAAHIAKRYALLNAGLESVIGIVLGIISLGSPAAVLPMWASVLMIVWGPFLAVLGGLIYLRFKKIPKLQEFIEA